MKADIDFAGAQDQGARPYQEDFSGFVDPQGSDSIDQSGARGLLAILTDGMGGHVGGAQASQTACHAFANHFVSMKSQIKQRLGQSLEASNSAIETGIKTNPKLEGMGCTLIATLLKDNQLHWISIGDSLLYLYRNGKLHRLNQDHSLASQIDEAAQRGEISEEEARNHPDRSVLLAAVTGEKMELVDEGQSVAIKPDDWIILASDGIETLSEDEICYLLVQHNNGLAIDLVETLLAEVKTRQKPHQDNITVLAIRGGRKKINADKARSSRPKTVPLSLKQSRLRETLQAEQASKQSSGKISSGLKTPKKNNFINIIQSGRPSDKTTLFSLLSLLLTLMLLLFGGIIFYLTGQSPPPANTTKHLQPTRDNRTTTPKKARPSDKAKSGSSGKLRLSPTTPQAVDKP